jgi:hypothetical protein
MPQAHPKIKKTNFQSDNNENKVEIKRVWGTFPNFMH